MYTTKSSIFDKRARCRELGFATTHMVRVLERTKGLSLDITLGVELVILGYIR
jgi:uncharacterized Fe-S cluster-containing protein